MSVRRRRSLNPEHGRAGPGWPEVRFALSRVVTCRAVAASLTRSGGTPTRGWPAQTLPMTASVYDRGTLWPWRVMAAQSSRPLDHEVDRLQVADQHVEIQVETLLEHLCRRPECRT
jgi:hypothetical protein